MEFLLCLFILLFLSYYFEFKFIKNAVKNEFEKFKRDLYVKKED